MIQRVQSIWLLLTCLTLVCLLFFPIATKHGQGAELTIYTTGLHQTLHGESGSGTKIALSLPLMISNIVLAVLAFANIFTFKNRILQKRIALTTIVLLAGLNFWVFEAVQRMPGGPGGISYGVGIGMPLLAIICCFFAIRGIRKDEQLIRSADRLR